MDRIPAQRVLDEYAGRLAAATAENVRLTIALEMAIRDRDAARSRLAEIEGGSHE